MRSRRYAKLVCHRVFQAVVIALLLSVGLINGCAQLPEEERVVHLPRLDNDNKSQQKSWTLLQPIDLGFSLSATQKLSANFNGQVMTFLMQLDASKEIMSLAVLNPALVSVFTLQDDGSHIVVERSPLVPKQLIPKYILADIQMVFWPLNKLNEELQYSGFVVSEVLGHSNVRDGYVKKRYLKNNAGNTLLSIHYNGDDHQSSPNLIEFEHLAWGYRYTIVNIDWNVSEFTHQ